MTRHGLLKKKLGGVPLLLLCILLLLQLLPSLAQDEKSKTTNYRWFCALEMNPVVTLEWDSTIRGYKVQREDDPEDALPDPLSGWTRRLFGSTDDEEDRSPPYLRSSTNLPEFMHPEAALFTSSADNRQLRLQKGEPPLSAQSAIMIDTAEEPLAPAPYVEARACDCWNSMVWGGAFYCTTPRTHCAIPSSPMGLPGCVDINKQRRIVRNIWPVLVVWYASVLFCLSFTLTGRHAMSCCIATVYPGWNRATADRLLRNDPNTANQMLLRHYRIMRARYERNLMRRLRRRSRRDRRRARQRRASADNGTPNPPDDDDDIQSIEFEEDMPFPNLWDLAIIPRPQPTNTSEPQPTTLTLKTRIYKQVDKSMEEDDDFNGKEPEIDLNDNGDEKDGDDELGDPDSAPVPSSESLATTELDSNSEITMPADETQSQTSTTEDKEKPAETTDKAEPATDAFNPAATNDPNNIDISEWDDHACTICYSELEDGDRVGALPCGHVFHVDPCLKHWLTRRNVCPLCLTENIATPNFTHPSGGDNANPSLSIVDTAPGNDDGDDSMSDQDRSSSRDQDDNSSGILEDDRNPNLIPAFNAPAAQSSANANRGARSRMIEMTSIFTRRRRQNATAADGSGESNAAN